MTQLAVWLDQDEAKIFRLMDDQAGTFTPLHAHKKLHHTHALDQKDHQRISNAFFEEVIVHLIGADGLVILGPGVAKFHFQTRLREHHPQLARKIVACESADHPTEGQISARARVLFNKAAIVTA